MSTRMVGDASEGLARLMAARDDGQLDQLCGRHVLQVLTLFGSAATEDPTPADLDLAYRSTGSTDHLRLLDDTSTSIMTWSPRPSRWLSTCWVCTAGRVGGWLAAQER